MLFVTNKRISHQFKLVQTSTLEPTMEVIKVEKKLAG